MLHQEKSNSFFFLLCFDSRCHWNTLGKCCLCVLLSIVHISATRGKLLLKRQFLVFDINTHQLKELITQPFLVDKYLSNFFFLYIYNCFTEEKISKQRANKSFTQIRDSHLYALICIRFSCFGFLMLLGGLWCPHIHPICNQNQIKLKQGRISFQWLKFQKTICDHLHIINLSWKSTDLTHSTIMWESAKSWNAWRCFYCNRAALIFFNNELRPVPFFFPKLSVL